MRVALGPACVVVHPHRGVHAERKRPARAPAPGQRFLGALAHEPALLRVHVRRDDAVAEPGEAVELRGQHLTAVAGRDEHGRPDVRPRQGADGVLGQREVVAHAREGLAAPERAPRLDVLLQASHAALVVGAARRPLALRRRQAPAHAEPHDHAAARDLVDVGDLVGEHDRVPQRRQEHGRPEPHASRDSCQIGQGRERLEPRLGDDAVADPHGVVTGAVGVPRHRPAFLHGRSMRGPHDHTAGRNEDAETHAGR